MPLTVYTRDELRDIILSHIRGRVQGANVAPYSDYWHDATALATVVCGVQDAAQYLVNQVLPHTAERKFLEMHAYVRGLERFQPAAAIGKAIVEADGATLVTVPEGTVVRHPSGRTYRTTSAALTGTPSWTGKLTAPGSNRFRLVITPSASGMAVDDVFTDNVGEIRMAARSVLPATGTPIAVDLYAPLRVALASNTPLEPVEAVVVPVEALEPGAAGNLPPGEGLALDAPVAGLKDDVIVLEMSGGGDLETDAELAARILAWMAERPGSGNRADYRDWARSTPGVRLADAFVYPAYRGPNSIDVIPFGVIGTRITGTAVNDRIQSHLEARASFADDVRVVQLTEPSATNVELTVTPAPGYERDWEGDYGVVGADTTHTVVEFTDPTDAIEIGDRVLIQTDTLFPRLWQRKVVGKLTGPDRIILDEPLPEAPSTGEQMRPGGPLAQLIIDALAALFDGLGPGDTMGASRYPTPGQVHPDGVLRASLVHAVKGLAGVANVTVAEPAVDVYPASLTRETLGSLTIHHL